MGRGATQVKRKESEPDKALRKIVYGALVHELEKIFPTGFTDRTRGFLNEHHTEILTALKAYRDL